jgi:hypothetical protein
MVQQGGDFEKIPRKIFASRGNKDVKVEALPSVKAEKGN